MNSNDKKVTLSDDEIITTPKKSNQNPRNAARELDKDNPSDFKNADGKDGKKADGRDPWKGSKRDKDQPADETSLGDASGS